MRGLRDDSLVKELNSFETLSSTFSKSNKDKLFNLFSSGLRSIPRSTGGLSSCEPYQLIYNPSDPINKTKIKVRFKDLKFYQNGELMFSQPVVHTKIVSPQELLKPFKYDVNEEVKQSFVLDIGGCLFPIYVIHYAQISEVIYAFFIEFDSLKNLLNLKKTKLKPISIFKIDRDVIRFARPELNEFEVAIKNYYSLKMKNKQIFDNRLAISAPLFIGAQKSIYELRKILITCIESYIKSKNLEIPSKEIEL